MLNSLATLLHLTDSFSTSVHWPLALLSSYDSSNPLSAFPLLSTSKCWVFLCLVQELCSPSFYPLSQCNFIHAHGFKYNHNAADSALISLIQNSLLSLRPIYLTDISILMSHKIQLCLICSTSNSWFPIPASLPHRYFYHHHKSHYHLHSCAVQTILAFPLSFYPHIQSISKPSQFQLQNMSEVHLLFFQAHCH